MYGFRHSVTMTGPEVGAADADVHNIGDPLSAVSRPLTASNLLRKIPHLLAAPRLLQASRLFRQHTIGRFSRLRSAMCSTGRFSVSFIRSPVNIFSIASAGGSSSARFKSSLSVSAVDPVLRVVNQHVIEADGIFLKPLPVGSK